ncbi:MAG: hypothetical protein ACLPND_00185 [Candidatus Korobacteraceae bacterium]|jgi:hypothetical protein
MSDQQSDTNSQFTRKSEKESICTYCFQTIKTDRYAPLEKVEDIHADVCLSKPNFAQRYFLL